MSDRRFLWHCLFLSLPTVAFVALGVYFLCTGVPRIVSNEHARAEAESRRLAEQLRSGDVKPDVEWEYGKGVVDGVLKDDPAVRSGFPATLTWKSWNARGGKRTTEMWGWTELPLHGRSGLARLVWVRVDRRARIVVSDIEEVDFQFWFWLLGPVLMVSLVVATAFAVYRLHSYAKSREDFLSAAAHDLTTPLAGMRHLIGRDDDEARLLNERMIRIVENIRDFQFPGGRRKPPVREVFEIGTAFDEAYRIFAADYEEETSGAIEVSGDRSLKVCADATLTAQILWNLLGNDLKYAAPYGKVGVNFAQSGQFVVVELADEGQGMTPRQMKMAFDRYWRAHTVLQSGKGGFGIGLCTAREFARTMGGDLSVKANTPSGCVFTLTLPAERSIRTEATSGSSPSNPGQCGCNLFHPCV